MVSKQKVKHFVRYVHFLIFMQYIEERTNSNLMIYLFTLKAITS
jgi:hypothetical protein